MLKRVLLIILVFVLGPLSGCTSRDVRSEAAATTTVTVAAPAAPSATARGFSPATASASATAGDESITAGAEGVVARCYDAPWRSEEQAACTSWSYLLVGALATEDVQWCSSPEDFPVQATAVTDSQGVRCYLHFEPTPEVPTAAAYRAFVGRCMVAATWPPMAASCAQQYSVLVTGVRFDFLACPEPTLQGVMSWALNAADGQVVCIQRYVDADPPRDVVAVPFVGSPDPPPVYAAAPGSPLRDGLADAPPSWNPPAGSGYAVVCSDGWVSHSGGRQGACSHHGGIGH